MPYRSISWSTLSRLSARRVPARCRRRRDAEDARGVQQLVEVRAAVCCRHRADCGGHLQQFQAVADGDAGDHAALGGHDDRDPAQRGPWSSTRRPGSASQQRGQRGEARPGRGCGPSRRPAASGCVEDSAASRCRAGSHRRRSATSSPVADERRPSRRWPRTRRPPATAAGRSRQSARPSWPAPLACHRSCQVRTGLSLASQSSTVADPAAPVLLASLPGDGERRRGQQPGHVRAASAGSAARRPGPGAAGTAAPARQSARPPARRRRPGRCPGRQTARRAAHRWPGPNSTFSDSGPVARSGRPRWRVLLPGAPLVEGQHAGDHVLRQRRQVQLRWWTGGRGPVPTARRSAASADHGPSGRRPYAAGHAATSSRPAPRWPG